MANKKLIFIPTYNESENVENIFAQIKALALDADLLFLDDNSPDGTGRIIDRIVTENTGVYAIHRSGKLGIGSAHMDGINWAYDHQYETLITMDCDFTHSPSYIIDFIEGSTNHSVVVGSRYMKEGSLKDWNLFRKTLTHLGHVLSKYILNLSYDATGAFRLYKLNEIPKELFHLVESRGYSFFFESLFIINYNKFRINEIPIDLPARTYGNSKMEIRDALKSLRYLLSTLRRKLFDKKSLLLK